MDEWPRSALVSPAYQGSSAAASVVFVICFGLRIRSLALLRPLHGAAGVLGEKSRAAGEMPGRDFVNLGDDLAKIGAFQHANLDQDIAVDHRHRHVAATYRMDQ